MKKILALLLTCILVLGLSVGMFVSADKNTLVDMDLPAALISGHSYLLQYGGATLKVNGTPCEGSFVAEGASVALEYTDAEGNPLTSCTIPVVDTQNATLRSLYFMGAEGDVTVSENRDDVAISFQSDAQVDFINMLSGESFSINMLAPEESTNYGALSVKLTDAADLRNSLTFRVDMQNGTVSLGENSAQLPQKTDIRLVYSNTEKRLTDSDSNFLLTCDTADNGEAFTGFSGGIYMSLSFQDVNGSSTLCVSRLNNQAWGHKDGDSTDYSAPMIDLTGALKTRQNMGEQFAIPGFTAYDVLGAVRNLKYEVELPDGTVTSETFTISQYGKYTITYSAEDGYGNKAKSKKIVYVNDDIAPQLQVSALEKTAYTLGETVKIPTYTVSDNLGSTRVDVILFLPNYEIRLLTSDQNGEITYALTDGYLYSDTFRNDATSFKTEQTGTYVLRFVANDDQYNRTVQELSFTVS